MTHRFDLLIPSKTEASGRGLPVVLSIAEGLEMISATAEAKGLPAVALSLRLVLADVRADSAALE